MTNSKLEILFVDDEHGFATRYLEELERHFQVTYVNRPEPAVDALRNNSGLAGVVLDIKMPVPVGVAPEVVENGLLTGLWILSQVEDHVRAQSLPIYVLTNHRLSHVQHKIEDLEIDVPRKLLRLTGKSTITARQLPYDLRSFITGAREAGASP